MSEDEFTVNSLLKSEKVMGQLRPVLVNQKGVVLDGNHRIAANKSWKQDVVETKGRADEIMVRLHAHHRRKIPQEETKTLVLELARELEKKGTPKEQISTALVKMLPYSESYVHRLLPREFKHPDKVKAGDISVQKKEEMQRVVTDCCGVGVFYPEKWHNYTLCKLHHKEAQLKPERWLGKLRKSAAPPANNRVVIQKPRIKDTWEHRKARMQVDTSKMEKALLEKWRLAGYGPVRIHREWCLESLEDDWFSLKFNASFFVDGPPHEGKQDYDNDRRDRHEKKHGVKVVPLKYKHYSKKEVERLWKIIEDKLGKEAALQ